MSIVTFSFHIRYHTVTSPLQTIFFFLARCSATRRLVCSLSISFVANSLYLLAFRIIHPPGTRSILRPSWSGSDDSTSGASSVSIAAFVSSTPRTARCARFAIDANWQKPSLSIVAKRVIQTRRVGVGSSQMEESTILLKSLLYTAVTVTNKITLVN